MIRVPAAPRARRRAGSWPCGRNWLRPAPAEAAPAPRDFRLCGVDAYPIAINDDGSQDLVPALRHFRYESVDSQRGQVQWRGRNPYFDQRDHRFG